LIILRNAQIIKCKLEVKPGEKLAVKVALGEAEITENFVLKTNLTL